MKLKTYIKNNYISQVDFARTMTKHLGRKVWPQTVHSWIKSGYQVFEGPDGKPAIYSKRMQLPE